uniref:Uncharacterized protein n=1 Tax=Myoviridae sp. ctP6q2 TaxID=2825096 RepID=A0A8S5UUM0_9CAUD|nr:MAG TPA: hypothetical protein [Myoviridae sp. ctP6q2]DAH68815.1 MAG TPA: hypothetical protein [Caudoviricetes sp.]DAZ18636.1 MAG TPA: hypothetical protein [Caudoviricetes sp.]
MIEITIVFVCLYLSYRLTRKPEDSFFYKN